MPRPVATLLLLASGCIVIAGTRQVSSLLGPVALAAILVITVFPLHPWLRSKKLPGWAATLGTILALAAVLALIGGSLAFAAAQLVNTIPDYSAEFTALYRSVIDLLARAGVSTDQIVEALRRIDPRSLFKYATGFLSGLSGFGSLMTILLVTMLFIAIDAAAMPDRLATLGRSKPDLVDALQDFAFRVRRYWLVSTVFGLIVAVLDTVALAWLGVPMALTFGVLAFITNYIPNVGFVIGLVPAALMALLDEGWVTALWVVVVYSAINFVVQTLIQPRFTGDAVGLTATLTFLSLLFWAWVLGPLGALLAVPLTLFVKALMIDRDPSARWLNVFVSNTGT